MITIEELKALQGRMKGNDFAKALGISPVHLSRLKHGSRGIGKRVEASIRSTIATREMLRHGIAHPTKEKPVITRFKQAVSDLLEWVESLED